MGCLLPQKERAVPTPSGRLAVGRSWQEFHSNAEGEHLPAKHGGEWRRATIGPGR